MTPTDAWLHPDVEIRPSPIQGLGLFARTSLPAGTVVSRLGGELVSTCELRRLVAAADAGERTYIDTITVGQDLHLVLPAGSPAGRGNHSCDPNTWWIDAVTLVARRDIALDDELTSDYATSTDQEDFVLDCACGTPLCRRTVRGGDWRRPDLWRRYGDHWVPPVLARILDLANS